MKICRHIRVWVCSFISNSNFSGFKNDLNYHDSRRKIVFKGRKNLASVDKIVVAIILTELTSDKFFDIFCSETSLVMNSWPVALSIIFVPSEVTQLLRKSISLVSWYYTKVTSPISVWRHKVTNKWVFFKYVAHDLNTK